MNPAVLEPTKQSTSAAPRGNLLFSRAFQVGASQVVRRCARFFFFFYAARKLGPATFGLYAMLLALVETLALISGEGFTDYLTRELAKSPILGRGLYVKVVELRLLYILVLFLPAILFLRALKYPTEILANASLLFLILFPRAPFGAGQGVLRAAGRFGLLVWLEAAQALVLLAVGIPLLIRAAALRSIIWAEVAAAFAAGLVSILMVQTLRQPKLKVDIRWSQVFRDTLTFNIYPLITNIYDRIDVVLLAALSGSVAAAIYAVPYRAIYAIQILPFALMTALLPAISAITASRSDKQLCSRMTGLLYSLALFPVLTGALLARPLLLLFLGRSYAGSTPVLQILIWAIIPMFVNYGLNIFLLARGHEKVFLRTTAVCAVVNIAANLILIPRFSYFAAAGVTILTELVLLVQNVTIIRRVGGFFPLPDKFWQTSVVFLLLLGGGLAGNAHGASLWPAAAAFLLLAVYFYFTGYVHSVLSWTRHGNLVAEGLGD